MHVENIEKGELSRKVQGQPYMCAVQCIVRRRHVFFVLYPNRKCVGVWVEFLMKKELNENASSYRDQT